uniref:Cytochrome c oxidase subunit 2 n=1 Tax=Lissoclinum sp. TIC-2013-079 TaxID=2010181 RepID=A0A2D1BXN5_9ASCI|nr:cytochrome c oxidase subunit II [Lissoclinum sp. TIC-2013-079]
MMFMRILPYNGLNIDSICMEIFHGMTFFIIFIILMGVCFVSFCIFKSSMFYSTFLIGAKMVEKFWTLFPMFLLVGMGIPSFFLLYNMEKESYVFLTFKTIGRQWYWSYESTDLGNLSFDSYMDTNNNFNRLLEVDNVLSLPYNNSVRLILSSSDVLHSWTLPSLYLKADAIPGRLNSFLVKSFFPGSYFGQCSEICGANHSFMPIHVEFLNWKFFTKWYYSHI